MISRALLRLRSPITNSLIHNLISVSHLSSSAAIYPGNAAAEAHSNSAAAPEGCGSAEPRKFGRLSTVTWSPRLHNSVSFIGTVEFPVKEYGFERFGVYTSLRVKTSLDSDTSFLITVEMWDELAERALLHLKQHDNIYISGELGSYIKANAEGKENLRYKVTAKELNYVKLDEPGKFSQRAVNPEKKTGEHLGESSLEKKNNRLHLWQILFADPNDWYDNRKNKKNPKQPDFKHKSTGEVLWFSERDPPWVKKQVELLDSRLSGGPHYDATFKNSPSRFVSDELLMVPNPTVTAEELDNVKPDEPGKNFQRVVNSGKETGEHNRLHLWKKFFSNPDEWYDNRKSKKNPKQPDFKHKSSGEALWLSERDSPWVKDLIELLDSRISRGSNNGLTSKFSPNKWLSDDLLNELNPTVTAEESNSIKLDESGKSFQRAVNSGNETCEHLGKSSLQKKNDRLHLWQKLFSNPDEWYDNRRSKKNPKQPDFKHKSSGEAIWLSERDSPWVKEQVELLDSRISRDQIVV